MKKDGRGDIAVLMDGTNCFFENKTTDANLAPQAKRQLWVDVVKEVAASRQIEVNPNPMTLWRARMDARRQEPREREGRRLSSKIYWRKVNCRTLRILAEREMVPSDLVTEEAGREMDIRYRRLGSPDKYIVYPDMAEFVAWLTDEQGFGAKLFMVTTQSRRNINKMFGQCQGQKNIFTDIYVAEELGIPQKLSCEFWKRVFRQTGIPPERTIMVGSNGISDGYAAQAGVQVVTVLDRDGIQEDYFRGIWAQTTSRDVILVGHNDPLPRGRAFTFIQTLDERVRLRFEQIRDLCLVSEG